MKTESQIRRKLRQVVFRHKKAEISRAMARRPENCSHNQVEEFKGPGQVLHRIRICTFKSEEVDWSRRLCDESFDGLRICQNCPFFQNKHSPESVIRDFKIKLGMEEGYPLDTERVAREYPDVMALYWALSDGEDIIESNTEEAEESEETKPLLLSAKGKMK